ncbi:conserved protein of unknown function [Methylorubrum extorquens]|uniref:Phage major tail protein, TP901-1 family n=1 Tax=Methylorubrum extorquens TaxID=408 RepID=A0A2N9AR63_METEX|nr:conserved protein of unknown function [Methylorubrum extorquens]
MAQPNAFGGKDLRVMRKSGPTDAAPKFMSTITTKGLTETMEYDDATVPNSDNPDQVWARRSLPKGSAWSVSFSGVADPLAYKQMRADMQSGVPTYVQIQVAKPAAQGGGRWDGAVFYENLQIQSDAGGVVKFTGQLRGDGELAWADAAAGGP